MRLGVDPLAIKGEIEDPLPVACAVWPAVGPLRGDTGVSDVFVVE